ncbi:MAG: MGMT family protein [Evtepia gabavorous]
MLQETLAYEVLSVVEEIPAGKVATYGQIARLIGRPRNARLVGRILRGPSSMELSLSPGGKPRRPPGPRLAGAGGPARGGGGLPEPERLCGFGPGPVGLLTKYRGKEGHHGKARGSSAVFWAQQLSAGPGGPD